PRARRDGSLDERRIHVEGFRIDVDEHRLGSGILDRGNRRYERKRYRDHFVTRADSGREQRQVQRAGAAIYADTESAAAVGRELLLELGDFGAENEPAAIEHALYRGVDLGLDTGVL